MNDKEYVGLVKRFGAFFLDYFIVAILAALLLFGAKFSFMPTLSNDTYTYFVWGTAFFYFILLESSFLQGTFGKVVGKIKVVNSNGSKISILHSVARFFTKLLSLLLFGLGFLMIPFTKNKQGLHDKLVKTYVVKYESYEELQQGNTNKFLFTLLKSIGWVVYASLVLFLIVSLVSSLLSTQAAKDVGNFIALVVGGIIWIVVLYFSYKLFFKITGADEGYLAAKMFKNTTGDIFSAFTSYDYKVKQKGDITSSKHRTKEDAIAMSKIADKECSIYHKKHLIGVWYKGKQISY
jgi:uncharacterized RDD family membrane protein YckC